VTVESLWVMFLLAWALGAGIQLVLYLRQRRTGAATAVDAGWAGSLVAIAVLYGVLGPGSLAYRALIVATCAVENLRIMRLVLGRVGRGEDERYRELRARWEERWNVQRGFLVFFEAQALLAGVLSLPILVAAANPDALGLLASTGAALWVVAAGFERAAGRQLTRFKADRRTGVRPS
jgi:steroid 5-alpha reductase family enzyme